ncbi:MAG: hypothetical protein ACRD0P_24845, partial [Stackebrandtia sp.]
VFILGPALVAACVAFGRPEAAALLAVVSAAGTWGCKAIGDVDIDVAQSQQDGPPITATATAGTINVRHQ